MFQSYELLNIIFFKYFLIYCSVTLLIITLRLSFKSVSTKYFTLLLFSIFPVKYSFNLSLKLSFFNFKTPKILSEYITLPQIFSYLAPPKQYFNQS